MPGCPAHRSRPLNAVLSRMRGGGLRSERGAVLVEFALVVPVLVLLVFAIIDFGFTFNDWISVRQGARDGLRQAIVKTTPNAPGGGTWSCPTPDGFVGTAPAAGSDAMNMV